MIRSIIFLAVVLGCFSCGNSNSPSENDSAVNPDATTAPRDKTDVANAGDTLKPDPNRSGGGQVPPQNDGEVRLLVSFISEGEGIDRKLKSDFDKWLTGRADITWETSPWGREGELNYCFRLGNLSTKEQVIFVRDVRTFLKDNKLVLIEEWAKCDKRN
jgi:hypothetical protein